VSGINYRALGRLGGLTTASTRDMRATAAHARAFAPSSLSYWEQKVDPEGQLDKSDREARARAAQSLHYATIARKRAKR